MSRDDNLHETEAFEMSPKNCPTCSTPVFDDLPGGLCPACLMAAARKSNPDYAQTEGRSAASRIEPPRTDHLVSLFPDLEIIEMIGAGGMGAVYKAKQKNLDRLVALKIFLFQDSDKRISDRFKQEARALAKFNHQNIVTIHDFGKRGEFHFLLMEYVDGPNLRQVVRGGEVSPADALALVPQLCDALQYAHEKGIVHRDIKPENVLIERGGKIKIADFGLAKITNQATELNLTNTQQVMGTLNYMAPEQRERPMEVDHRADIYSLGVVIYELLTGELPLGRFDPPSKCVNVDKRFDEVVMRALEKEPNRRYQHASEFKTGIQSVAHLAPDRIQPVPPVKSRHPVPADQQNDGADVKSIPEMIYFMVAMLVCFIGAIWIVLSTETFFEKELSVYGGKSLGILIVIGGGYFLACSGFFSQMVAANSKTSVRLLAALGCIAMFAGVAGAGLMVAASSTDEFFPVPANAVTEQELQKKLAVEKGWSPSYRTVEDFKETQDEYERILRAGGIASCILCGFLFVVYGMLDSQFGESAPKVDESQS